VRLPETLHPSRWIDAFRRDPLRAAAAFASLCTLVAIVVVVMAPWLSQWSTFGFHDWDVQTAHRYLVRKTLLEDHQFPFWNPYACGGFPAWGFVEGDTVLVSPWLPAYLALPMSVALRIEVLGMALIGAAGAYACASRFSASHAARALVAALWAVNGRWALQTAAGHTWHLAYAWMPWALFFFERARKAPNRALDVALCGGTFAMLVYGGGIYPLPHTVLALSLYALCVALLERSPRPLLVLGVSGVVGVGLAAPRLLPLLDGFKKAPRLIDSTESLDVGALVNVLMSRDQSFFSRPARVAPYGWHEWGMYISVAGFFILAFAFLLVQGKRETALKVTGAFFGVLGLGAFHPMAPWTLLHAHAPVFRSQHVPSRFLYPAVLLLALVAAAGIGRLVERQSLRRPWLDLVLVMGVLAIGVDVASVAQKPMAQAMWMVAPDNIPKNRPFHFEQEPPFQYKKRDWAGPMYLAMIGNTGVLNCYGAPPFDRKGAIASRDPRYRGEAFLAEGSGAARVSQWSPNRVDIDVDGATAGALLVYNMNYDEGWRASAGAVENFENKVAVRLPAGTTQVTLRYVPQGFGLGLVCGLLTLAGVVVSVRRERREALGQVTG
jgi:hypothetical protein